MNVLSRFNRMLEVEVLCELSKLRQLHQIELLLLFNQKIIDSLQLQDSQNLVSFA
jgi:hypothetical protein